MGMIREAKDSLVVDIYGRKALSIGVSYDLLVGSNGEGGINILSMIKKSKTKEDFDKLAIDEIIKVRNTDFYHYSLLMGQYFGIYNIYSYVYVEQDSREFIMKSNPNFFKTKKFIEEHDKEIFQYINSTYSVDYDFYGEVLERIFNINYDNSIYNNDVVKDISKILMGNDLYNIRNNGTGFIGCREAIDYFEKQNEIKNNFNK